MACTLLALLRFEEATGTRTPPASRATTRALIWALLSTFQPALTVRDVGAMMPGEYRTAMEAAAALVSGGTVDAAPEAASTDEAPPGWLQIWSVGRFDLGLTDAEFWQLSPAMFDALWKRLEDQRERALYGHAMTCAQVFNAQRTTDEARWFEADDFMPKTEAKRLADEKRQTAAQRAALHEKLQGVVGILGAKII